MTVTDRFRLDCQMTLVTGAAAGIGRGFARMFAMAGSAVVVTDLKKEGAETVAQEIKSVGGRAIGRTCNVTTEEEISAAIDAAGRSLGKLIGSHDDSSVLMADPAKIQCLRWQVH